VAGVPPALVVVQPTRLPPQKNGEGGKKVSPKAFGPKARSQNICPFHLIRVAACADGPKKLLREKEE
jgi:hypothetical protein